VAVANPWRLASLGTPQPTDSTTVEGSPSNAPDAVSSPTVRLALPVLQSGCLPLRYQHTISRAARRSQREVTSGQQCSRADDLDDLLGEVHFPEDLSRRPSSRLGADFLCRLEGSAPRGGALSRTVPAVTFPGSRKWFRGTSARVADAQWPCYSGCGGSRPFYLVSNVPFDFLLFNTHVLVT